MKEADKYINTIIDSKYMLKKQLGSGSFGTVFEAFELTTNRKYAIKLEPTQKKANLLKTEYHIYKDLQNQTGFSRIYDYGEISEYRYLIMDLLGDSLHRLIKTLKKFSLETTLMLAEQMITRIETFHSKNYIHRDIKPENFIMGTEFSNNIIYLIDYGLAKRYKQGNTGKHIPFRDGKTLTGTIRFASVNAHLGIEISRRDDLESLGYVLLLFVNGNLPWVGIKGSNKKAKMEEASNLKISTSIESLCKCLPEEFFNYFFYVKKLKFDEKPDYNMLKNNFKCLLFDKTQNHNTKLDWLVIKSPPLHPSKEVENKIENFKEISKTNANKVLKNKTPKTEVELPEIPDECVEMQNTNSTSIFGTLKTLKLKLAKGPKSDLK